FLLNNFLYGLNFSLSFYQPCSYHCKNALKYNKNILEAVRKENPNYAAEIEKNLRFPLLIWFDALQDSDANDFFHKRIQLLFKGVVNNSSIYYKDVILYRKYPRCNDSFKENQLKEFLLGTHCLVSNDKITIFKRNKILKKLKINNKYHAVLVKFN
ncbi:hypothetical protein KKH35_03525, partial [Patescibacteria group bacterium]|nr:hypothetical protein [Patescibacteria group bacterium]